MHFDVAGAQGPKRYFGRLTPQELSHAYLFSGPSGVGKKTFARRLAQSLLCTASKESLLGYDGTCTSCRLFSAQAGRHPDFLDHEGVLKIGDADAPSAFYDGEELSARDLVRQLSMQSYSGGMRVLLLGDVDFATPAAANALLKFLEEPPNGVVMILTTATPGRLLATIRSRTVEVRFPTLSAAEVVAVLEGLNHSAKDAKSAAALAGGSISRALGTLEGEEESLRAQVARWFFEVVGGRTPPESWATRETLDDGLEVVKMLVRDWVVVGNAIAAEPLAADHLQCISALPPPSERSAMGIFTKLDEAAHLARTNVNPALVAEYVRMALTNNP